MDSGELVNCCDDEADNMLTVKSCNSQKLEDLMVSGKSPKAYVRIKGQKVPPPFPNGWFSIAESSEIVSGAAKSISCLGEDFAVFRSTKDDQVYVLDAFCPHMGANLGVGGIVRDNCIECPFHQWRFNGQDGKLMEIPYSKSLSESEWKFFSAKLLEIHEKFYSWEDRKVEEMEVNGA